MHFSPLQDKGENTRIVAPKARRFSGVNIQARLKVSAGKAPALIVRGSPERENRATDSCREKVVGTIEGSPAEFVATSGFP